jgi:hypothetical protein
LYASASVHISIILLVKQLAPAVSHCREEKLKDKRRRYILMGFYDNLPVIKSVGVAVTPYFEEFLKLE